MAASGSRAWPLWLIVSLTTQAGVALAASPPGPPLTSSSTVPACVGDCDDGGSVTVDELVTGVNMLLGATPVIACPHFDVDDSTNVTVDELVTGVNNLLAGCPAPPPTPTSTATPTVSPAPSNPLVVMTGAGLVQGRTANGVRSFYGIPYAEPPIGDLRWRSPMPHAAWSGIRKATAPGQVCLQRIPYVNLGPVGSEDCLFLNVETPDPPPTLRPVMVWIHGGAFTTGDGLQSMQGGATDGAMLVQKEGVVVVTFNYRLGQFGFLAHPALTSEDPNHPSSGNYGMEDQIAALKWVHDNIAAFGGDPGNVTIFGESAGGWSVCAHVASPLSAGLFQRAIVESGLCAVPRGTLAEGEQQGETFAAALGCAGDEVLSCLRSKKGTDILKTLPPDPNIAFTPGTWGTWWPAIDGYALERQLADTFADGSFHHVPLLIGSNKDEGTLFVAFAFAEAPLTADQYPEVLKYFVKSDDLVAQVMAQYPLANYPDPGAALAAAFGDGFLACPTIDTADLAAPYVPTYLYQFEYPDAGFPLTPPVPLGAFHSAEVQFVFQRSPLAGVIDFTDEEIQMSNQIMGYWTQFARTGDPNELAELAWPRYDTTQPYLALNLTTTAAQGPKATACAFWKGLHLY